MSDGAIALDSQLLVLLVVGLTAPRLVLKHKKTRPFGVEDFELLVDLIGARPLLLLPNTVTEASNHLTWHQPPERDDISRTLARLVATHIEIYVPSTAACSRPEHFRIGVADCALLLARAALLMTADVALYLAAISAGVSSVNFNHERERHGLA